MEARLNFSEAYEKIIGHNNTNVLSKNYSRPRLILGAQTIGYSTEKPLLFFTLEKVSTNGKLPEKLYIICSALASNFFFEVFFEKQNALNIAFQLVGDSS